MGTDREVLSVARGFKTMLSASAPPHEQKYENPAPLKIEEGKYYKTRSGRKVGPAKYAPDNEHDPVPWGLSDEWWPPHGTYYGDGTPHPHDLIAEWTDEPTEPPASPAPGPAEPVVRATQDWSPSGRRREAMTQERTPVSPEAVVYVLTANPEPCAGCGLPLGMERYGYRDLPGSFHRECLHGAASAAQLAAAREAGKREGDAAGYRRGMEEAAQMVERDEIDSSVRLDPQKHKNLSEWINAQRAAAIRAKLEER